MRSIDASGEIQRIYDSIPPDHPEAGQKYKKNKEVVYLIICAGVGFAELYKVGVITSIGIYVHPDYRGCGFGKKLVAACQDYARKKSEAIEWYVAAENLASRNLAKSCGFRMVKYLSNTEMKTYIWEGR